MAEKRDYGTFSTAAGRILKPMIVDLGYQQITGATFGRERDGWVEGFFLQQSGWGSGDFWVNVGIHIPQLYDLWQEDESERSFGLTIGTRLDNDGVQHGAQSYPAQNKLELQSSLTSIAEALKKAEAWFQRFQSMTDIATEYEKYNSGELANINRGFLWLLAGDKLKAKTALDTAHRQWNKIVLEEDPYLERERPGKDALAIHASNVHRLTVIADALAGLEYFDHVSNKSNSTNLMQIV